MAKIFLVDDDDSVRDALSRLLANLDLPVVACADGDALLAACTPEQPGCVVLDLDLPGMNGLQAQAALRARGIELPVIFLTGKGSVASTAWALKAGAFDFLEKPVEGRLLLARVQDALREDALRREQAARRREAQLRLAPVDGPRTRGHRAGAGRPGEQGGGEPAGHQPPHGRDPPGASDAQDGCVEPA